MSRVAPVMYRLVVKPERKWRQRLQAGQYQEAYSGLPEALQRSVFVDSIAFDQLIDDPPWMVHIRVRIRPGNTEFTRTRGAYLMARALLK